MEKTIEERARDYAINKDCKDASENGYWQGATEQKHIDKEKFDVMLSSAYESFEKYFIGKACEWLSHNYGHFDGSIEDLLNDFCNAMEE